jgi:FAD/FMN-containing dehydrogenase
MTTTVGSDNTQLETLQAAFSGSLLHAENDGYHAARQIHNGLIDRRPALIARCLNAADVADAVRFARASGLEICVRGGGHNVAGRAVVDDALMIDLSLMKGIRIDPEARTARAQGGVIWRELNREAGAHGLAVTGGAISTTGIAGYTLGGGLGWLMAKYGLAADNLLSVEVVTADGEILNVSTDSHPDLFWALRGGGGNFGIATSFEYRLHHLPMVVGGLIAHPFDAAEDLLRFYREASESASDDLNLFGALVHAPDGSGMKLSALLVCHTGDPEAAENELAPIKAFGSPLMVEVGPMPYPIMNTLLDDGFPAGLFNYWLSSFARGFDDGLIATIVERFATVPSPMSAIVIEHFHGEVTRHDETEIPVPHREKGWNLLIPSIWADPAATEANIAWTRETHAALAPHLAGRRWLNYLGDDQADDAIRAAYGPNYDRLAQIKGKYDPENVFHHNHNIRPASS